MHPVLFRLGPLTVYSYGAALAVAFLAGTWLFAREYRRRGGDLEDVPPFALGVFVTGFLASHLLWAVTNWGVVRDDPLGSLLSAGGHVWYGALLGGVAGGWILTRRLGMGATRVLDSAAVGLPLGHAIGRIGCHLSGDGDWGTVSELPWAVAYREAIVGWPHPPGVRVHPTPIYESLAYLAVFGALLALRRKPLPPAALFALFLVGTSVARFAIELVRVNPAVAFGLTQAQLIALGLLAAGLAALGLGRRRAGSRG